MIQVVNCTLPQEVRFTIVYIYKCSINKVFIIIIIIIIFQIPSWIPMLPDPVIEFNLEPPTYQQVTNIISKMKTSGSITFSS